MKGRLVIRIVLFAIVAAGIGRWAWEEFGRDEPAVVGTSRPDGLTVLALHGDKRCRTCIRISDLAREEIGNRFAAELADGRLHWENVNYEQPEHRELAERYGLVSSTIVLSRWKDGAETDWKKLDEVWDLIGDEPEYREFIATRVAAMLETP
ncbi:nitrophenyl compound nitroreductase subunit ArsF family protein [Haloferula sp. A504]|uniref:nitrophenyl compound nitroreductase subunit ArsF family protein n=1 Tax=Haloferula sp. A504 TaxID=3373601 RepID=UPI0031C4DBA7|nr:nitrophenyl compound nitroreductase subunit ArsF family protein [Verrucomicrobiaceae bacterium E54]